MFATRTRNAGSGRGGWRGAAGICQLVPTGFEAVAEALQVGVGSADACLVVGRRLADDGTPLEEALRRLRTTSLAINAADPAYGDIEALCLAWSESTLGYLHQLSCEDPMTGLASLAHMRSRLSELYRGELRLAGPHGSTRASSDSKAPDRPTPRSPAPSSAGKGPQARGRVGDRYALIVLDVPHNQGADHDQVDEGLTRALQLAQLGLAARTVFAGSEIAARLGSHRIGVLAVRDARLGRRVALLSKMVTGEAPASEPLGGGPLWGRPTRAQPTGAQPTSGRPTRAQPTRAQPTGAQPTSGRPTRVWIEGLPDTDAAAGQLLDELARAGD
ncbi:MAG: hypothetical protein ACRCYU_05395 [Nocardioides sp.]